MPRLFFSGDIGDIQRLKVRYAFESKVPNEREKGKAWRGFGNPLLGSKAKPVLLKQSVKLKCQISSILIKKFSKKCIDASSL